MRCNSQSDHGILLRGCNIQINIIMKKSYNVTQITLDDTEICNLTCNIQIIKSHRHWISNDLLKIDNIFIIVEFF